MLSLDIMIKRIDIMGKIVKEQKIEVVRFDLAKIVLKENASWDDIRFAEMDEGIYLCENPDGSQFLMSIDSYGTRYGFYLPIKIIIDSEIKSLNEKLISCIYEYVAGIEAKLNKIESLANDSNIILNECEEKVEENAQSVAQSLINLEKLLKELPKHSEQQKSTLAEMSDAVVNIIKATK